MKRTARRTEWQLYPSEKQSFVNLPSIEPGSEFAAFCLHFSSPLISPALT